MSTEIDLGVSNKDRYGGLGSPMAVSGPSDSEKKLHYPTFTYEGPEELDLPEEGILEIRFKKRRETSKVREDGKHWYECEIEVRCICEVESEEEEAPTRRDTSAEDALDALAEALGKSRESDGD
jgi:hypothetical protein